MIPVDRTAVLAEVERASRAYEEALAAGDVDALVSAFWDSDRAVRFGDDEELFGADQVAAFRHRSGSPPVRRRTLARRVTAFGSDVASVCLVTAYPSGRTGRQTQVWVRTDAGWRVAHAHVSWPLRSRERPTEPEEGNTP